MLGYTIEVINYMLGDVRIFVYSRQVPEEVYRVIGTIYTAALIEGSRY